MSGRPTITVVGAGVVGGNLVRRLVDLGHDVTIAARDPGSDAVRSLAASVPATPVVELAVAGSDADVVVLAVPAAAVAAAATGALAARSPDAPVVLVDANNDVSGRVGSPYDAIVGAVGRVGVSVVKAFNTIGAEAILRPTIDGHRLFLPIAGPAGAAETVRDLAADIGFDALVIGGVEAVPHLEAHARLWIHLAFGVGLGRDFGFARLHRAATA